MPLDRGFAPILHFTFPSRLPSKILSGYAAALSAVTLGVQRRIPVLANTPGLVPPESRRLTGAERETMSCWSQALAPVSVLSALLRRICLFEHHPWMIPSGREGQVCYLGWPLRQTELPITALLLHPVTGITATISEPGWTSDRHTVIPLNMASSAASRTILVLPAHTMPTDQLTAS